ncbi:molybdate ABC transporter substrate-binding protein [Clostridium sporogenes]|uniref:Molybdate ABC transporter substrate-binding protein n=2 Tax=Clostridium TaxID=1485 RepID=A0AAE5CAL2_CLOSG|nr:MULTISPECIES: molybdate ABC transporter substrate-binding protein [Clostridium]EKS4342295.1 molybdate ABC transporter substrate-binding protein [Clostridium botulinum]MBE6076340.1 molybdate ABC transporter substrate-binding protein [Clostridium lundense]EDU37293.1 molybdate ABC transporter, periplasmic molybdate-binding protein [Clostridium sporogenes ATCC 15579]EKS4393762.1 molybdate ABC transporter substrate-binding protein [Clostridium botulinum]KIS23493.1 molybdenum ABC transporter subs
MKKILSFLIVSILALGLFGCTNTKVEEKKEDASNKKESKENLDITVSAAASLTEALTEIQKKYEKETGAKLSITFDASGTLQKQIEQGAPTDLFISASKKNMDKLQEEKLIDNDTRKDLLGNKLVLIVSEENRDKKVEKISDLKNMNFKLAIGEPESVPAGKYAKEAIEYYKLWDVLKDKIVYGKSVKQVAKYVESGEAAAGIVYNNDAKVLKKSYIKYTFDEKSHNPIVYPMAVVKNSKNKEGAKKFAKYIQTKEAKDIFIKYGFNPIEK